MDHIPLPRDPIHGHVEVPCLAIEEYDGTDFLSYGDGKDIFRLADPSGTSLKFYHSNDAVAPYLQTWLFFGILWEVFKDLEGQDLGFKTFTRLTNDLPQRRLIDTTQLPQIALKWINHLQRFDRSARLQRCHKVRNTLGGALQLLRGFLDDSQSALPSEIWLSINLLFEFIELLNLKAARVQYKDDSNEITVPDLFLGDYLYRPSRFAEIEDNFLITRFKDDGWCPSDIAMIKRTFSKHAMYFIGNMERPKREFEHPSCNERNCSLRQTNLRTYKPAHWMDDGCSLLKANQTELRDILASGSYPLISTKPLIPLNNGEDFKPSIKFVRASAQTPYVAISHLWSDGLGNPHDNALPLCSLVHLSLLACLYFGTHRPASSENSDMDYYFWIDTICCPAQKGEAKNLGLSKMRDVYSNAASVLVIDDWFRRKASEELEPHELLLRLFCSPWNRRLWTFQEAALAQLIVVWCEPAGLIDVDLTVLKCMQNEDISLALCLTDETVTRWNEAQGAWRYRASEAKGKLPILMSALRFKSTSNISDEAICLGTILRRDVMKIISGKKRKRMQRFWSSFLEVPCNILRWQGPRLATQGFGWAPRTILNSVELLEEMEPSPKSLEVSTRGLIIDGPGFLIRLTRKQWPQKEFYFIDEVAGRCCTTTTRGEMFHEPKRLGIFGVLDSQTSSQGDDSFARNSARRRKVSTEARRRRRRKERLAKKASKRRRRSRSGQKRGRSKKKKCRSSRRWKDSFVKTERQNLIPPDHSRSSDTKYADEKEADHNELEGEGMQPSIAKNNDNPVGRKSDEVGGNTPNEESSQKKKLTRPLKPDEMIMAIVLAPDNLERTEYASDDRIKGYTGYLIMLTELAEETWYGNFVAQQTIVVMDFRPLLAAADGTPMAPFDDLVDETLYKVCTGNFTDGYRRKDAAIEGLSIEDRRWCIG